MNNYFITGEAGFIGSNTAEEILKRANKVKIIDDLSTGSKENGMETVCPRYSNIFVSRQNPNFQYASAIPKFIKAIKNKEHDYF